jgi:hypothetical protein
MSCRQKIYLIGPVEPDVDEVHDEYRVLLTKMKDDFGFGSASTAPRPTT